MHAERVIRTLPDDTVEVVSVYTEWYFSGGPFDDSVSVSLVTSRLWLFGDDSSRDFRITEFATKNLVGYTVDPVSCELSFESPWNFEWNVERYIYRGDVAEAEVRHNGFDQTIVGEKKVDVSILNDEGKFLLNVYNGLRPKDSAMTTFSAKVVDGNILIGTSDSGVVLRPLRAQRGRAWHLWAIKEEYRAGVNEGFVDREDVIAKLGDEPFVNVPLWVTPMAAEEAEEEPIEQVPVILDETAIPAEPTLTGKLEPSAIPVVNPLAESSGRRVIVNETTRSESEGGKTATPVETTVVNEGIRGGDGGSDKSLAGVEVIGGTTTFAPVADAALTTPNMIAEGPVGGAALGGNQTNPDVQRTKTLNPAKSGSANTLPVSVAVLSLAAVSLIQ